MLRVGVTVRHTRGIQTAAVLLLLVSTAAAGYLTGATRAQADGKSAASLPEVVSDAIATLGSGETDVVMDAENNWVCAVGVDETGASSACTSQQAEEPMLMVSESSGAVTLTVVDPGDRIDSLRVVGANILGAEAVESLDAGQSASVITKSLPEVVTVIGKDGSVLAEFYPAGDAARADLGRGGTS
jgi:hypothetical protein